MKLKYGTIRKFDKNKKRNKLKGDAEHPDRKCCICLKHQVLYDGDKGIWQSYGTGDDKTWCHWRCRNDVNRFKGIVKKSNEYLDEFIATWNE